MLNIIRLSGGAEKAASELERYQHGSGSSGLGLELELGGENNWQVSWFIRVTGARADETRLAWPGPVQY